jgi:hypothetical protein
VATRSDSIVVLQLRKASKPGCVLVCHGTHMKWKRLATALRRPGIRRRLPHIAEVMFASGGRSPLAAYLFIRTLGARAAYDEWCGLPAKWGAPSYMRRGRCCRVVSRGGQRSPISEGRRA